MLTPKQSPSSSVKTDKSQGEQHSDSTPAEEGLGAGQHVTQKPEVEALMPGSIMQLQHIVGNRTVARLVSQLRASHSEHQSGKTNASNQPGPVLQRNVLFKQSEHDYSEPSVENIINWLQKGGFNVKDGEDFRSAVEKMIASRTKYVFPWHGGQGEFMKTLQYFRKTGDTLQREHLDWLVGEGTKYKIGGEYYALVTHEETQGGSAPKVTREETQGGSALRGPQSPLQMKGTALLSRGKSSGGAKTSASTSASQKQTDVYKHYNFFDQNMLWRFTSTPSEEFIVVAEGVDYTTIVKVVAAHSGGNDKSNQDVKTLSFGRNLGALMGVAASGGGDKHVTNIIDKAEYLYGIDITTLSKKGITAHPARGRLISLFETEYILVGTPGNPAHSLDELATNRYKNPFKGGLGNRRNIFGEDVFNTEEEAVVNFRRGLDEAIKDMGTIVPETRLEAQTMPTDMVQRILAYAKAVYEAANKFAVFVQDKRELKKDEENIGLTLKMLAQIPLFITLLEERLQQTRL